MPQNTTMSDEYTPIACGRYDELELAIMHRSRLKLVWREDGIEHVAVVLPRDLRVREKVEYLLYTHDGAEASLRLDRIRRFEVME